MITRRRRARSKCTRSTIPRSSPGRGPAGASLSSTGRRGHGARRRGRRRALRRHRRVVRRSRARGRGGAGHLAGIRGGAPGGRGPVEVEVGGVASDSLGARRAGAVPWAVMRAQGVGSVLVTDEAIRDAQRRLWAAVRVGAEPGGRRRARRAHQPRLRPGAGRAGRRDRQRRELRPRGSRVTKRFFGRPTDRWDRPPAYRTEGER